MFHNYSPIDPLPLLFVERYQMRHLRNNLSTELKHFFRLHLLEMMMIHVHRAAPVDIMHLAEITLMMMMCLVGALGMQKMWLHAQKERAVRRDLR